MTRLRSVVMLFAGLLLSGTVTVKALDQCNQVCGPTESCETECEDYGNCGNYAASSGPEWCDGGCGDDYCNPYTEDEETCIQDCGECGDGICDLYFNVEFPCGCVADCGSCESVEECELDYDCPEGMECKDGVCGRPDPGCSECDANEFCCYDYNDGEYCCDFLYGCGDGVCSPGIGENVNNCTDDCSAEWNCGNHVCGYPHENNSSCSLDCFCGDGICAVGYEYNYWCPSDCPS